MLLYSVYAQLVISSAPSIITLNHSLAFHQLIYISMLVSLHTLYMNLAKLIKKSITINFNKKALLIFKSIVWELHS